MTDESQVDAFFALLSAAKWWILGIGLVAALVAGVFGWPGSTLYEASVPVRVQFPSNLIRAPQPDRFAQMVRSSQTVEAAAADAGLSSQLEPIKETLVAAVSPTDARVVSISVQLAREADGRRFLQALVASGKAEAMGTVKDEMAGLRESQKLNRALEAQMGRVIEEGERAGRALRATEGLSTGDRLLAQVGLLQVSVSALQSTAALQNLKTQVDADLESLGQAITPEGGISVAAVSPASHVVGYALRGLIVGLAVALLAVFLPPVRQRFAS